MSEEAFYQGQRVRVRATFRDPVTRELTDPGSAIVKFKKPDDTFQEVTMNATDNEAEYAGSIVCDQYGVWRYRIETPAPFESVRERNFNIIESEFPL